MLTVATRPVGPSASPMRDVLAAFVDRLRTERRAFEVFEARYPSDDRDDCRARWWARFRDNVADARALDAEYDCGLGLDQLCPECGERVIDGRLLGGVVLHAGTCWSRASARWQEWGPLVRAIEARS